MADFVRSAAIAELRSHECGDLIQRKALERACAIVAASGSAARLEELEVLVLDPARASPELRQSPYFTGSCAALLVESAVVVNVNFLAEIEAAIRAFATAGSLLAMPQLNSDPALFDLVRQIRPMPPRLARQVVSLDPDPWPHLKRLRRLTTGYGAPTREGDTEEDLRYELALVVLFFLAHEVGHLLDGKDERSFGSFLNPKASLEHRVSNAVVKMTRHVDEFRNREHDLPGFDDFNNPDSEVRVSVTKMAAELGDVSARHEEWFADENSADEWANRLVDEYLASVAAEDSHEAARTIYLFSRGVFAAGLFSWYGDLLSFCNAIGTEGLPDARSLMFAMMQNRQNYIRAASLFGEIHRCTLLRAELAIANVIENRTDWLEHTNWTRTTLDSAGPAQDTSLAREKWWLEECVLRWCLLGAVVDTAVKLAYLGASTSSLEQKRGGSLPIIMMTFDSIDKAVTRLSRR